MTRPAQPPRRTKTQAQGGIVLTEKGRAAVAAMQHSAERRELLAQLFDTHLPTLVRWAEARGLADYAGDVRHDAARLRTILNGGPTP